MQTEPQNPALDARPSPNPPLPLEPETTHNSQLIPHNSPISPDVSPTVIDTRPVPAAAPHRKSRRTGRIACLPKLMRDMVNRMLDNGVPYKNIVLARLSQEIAFGGFFARSRR